MVRPGSDKLCPRRGVRPPRVCGQGASGCGTARRVDTPRAHQGAAAPLAAVGIWSHSQWSSGSCIPCSCTTRPGGGCRISPIWHRVSYPSRDTGRPGFCSLARRLADVDRDRLGAWAMSSRWFRFNSPRRGTATPLPRLDSDRVPGRMAKTAWQGDVTPLTSPAADARFSWPIRHGVRHHNVRRNQSARTLAAANVPVRRLVSHHRGSRIPRSPQHGRPAHRRTPFAYHTLEYGPAVGANLAVQVPLANLITRYSGLSMVWLLVLLLFNSARHIRSPTAGFFAAALIVAPLDVFSLISSKLSFGSSIMYSGLDRKHEHPGRVLGSGGPVSASSMVFAGGRIRDLWVVALLAYMAAGSKSVPGLLLLVAARCGNGRDGCRDAGARRAALDMLGIFTVVFCSHPPVIVRPLRPIRRLSRSRPPPDSIPMQSTPQNPRLVAAGFYPIGLSFALWIGSALGVWKLAKPARPITVLVSRLRSAVCSRCRLRQFNTWESELFFLYMAMVLIAPVAGTGLCDLGQMLWRGGATTTPVVILILLVAALGAAHQGGRRAFSSLRRRVCYGRQVIRAVTEGVDAYRDPGLLPRRSWSGPRRQRARVTPGDPRRASDG